MTNGDIGGGGSKIWHFYGDVTFEWPKREQIAEQIALAAVFYCTLDKFLFSLG